MVHVDMKHFHLYNTFFGDKAGDKLLCDVADMFRWMSKDYDHWAYGRIEADVFCAFFPFIQERYDKHLGHVLEALENYRDDFLIEPVIGLYKVTDRSMPIEAMFARANIAAKTIKAGSAKGTVVYNEEMERRMTEEQQVVNEMQTAINQEQFKVYLQPKYSLRTNKPVGAEALVRWIHPEKGMISPAQFIPVFERNGFIANLDRYMWEHVCQLLYKWREEGKVLAPVSVNVSRISMFIPTTVAFLKGLVKKYEIEPKYLELELTESAYIDDPEEMKIQMNALREAGFKILMDDFGSGYSSLNTLRELPVDCLKLDMKFLSHEEDDLRGSLVLASIVRMSKLLNLYTIAEGVESKEQADFLRGIGCEFVQGFLFARPMPVEEYEKILLTQDIPLVNRNWSDIELIGKMLADTKTQTYSLGEVIPVAMALLEYQNEEFTCLRVNPLFISEFDMEEDFRSENELFRSHMDEEEYGKMTKAFLKCFSTKQPVVFQMQWNGNNGKKRNYVGRVAFEGQMGDSVAMVVVFTNVTEFDCLE